MMALDKLTRYSDNGVSSNDDPANFYQMMKKSLEK